MSSEAVIKARSLSKSYQVFERPQDRFLQMLARGGSTTRNFAPCGK